MSPPTLVLGPFEFVWAAAETAAARRRGAVRRLSKAPLDVCGEYDYPLRRRRQPGRATRDQQRGGKDALWSNPSTGAGGRCPAFFGGERGCRHSALRSVCRKNAPSRQRCEQEPELSASHVRMLPASVQERHVPCQTPVFGESSFSGCKWNAGTVVARTDLALLSLFLFEILPLF